LDFEIEIFYPIEYSSQVVAGMNYDVIYEVGSSTKTSQIEVHLYRDLMGETQITDVKVLEKEPEMEDGLLYGAMTLLI